MTRSWWFEKAKTHKSLFLGFCLWLILVSVLIQILGNKELFLVINQNLTKDYGMIFKYLTCLGEGWFIFPISLWFLLRRLDYGTIILGAYGLASLISSIMKHFIFKGVPRPKVVFQNLGFYTVEGVDLHSFNSFPSGHTLSAFAVFTAMAFVLKRPRWDMFWLILAMFTGLSRVVLGQHFPMDVLAGSVIGFGSALFSDWLFEHKIPPSWKISILNYLE